MHVNLGKLPIDKLNILSTLLIIPIQKLATAFHMDNRGTVIPLKSRCTTAQYSQTICAVLSHSCALPTF